MILETSKDFKIAAEVDGKYWAVTDLQFINTKQARLYGGPGADTFLTPAPLLPELQLIDEVIMCGRRAKSMDYTDGVLTVRF